jgi:ribosomal protein S16
VLGSFNPIKHEFIVKVERVEELLTKGAQLSERVAKLMFQQTNNNMYKKFFTIKNLSKPTKNPDKYN